MGGRFKKEQVILYFVIVIGYLIHWIHNDLEYHPGQFAASLQNNVWQVIYITGANILFFEYALPFVTAQKTYRLLYIVSSIILYLVAFAFGLYVWRTLGSEVGIYRPFKTYLTEGSALSDSVRFAPGPFLLFAVFKLFFDYARLKFQEQQVQLEKKQAELMFLKSQMNPHFLFNTLNNIYSLSQHQPKLVSESILRLSKMLRYVLYEANHEFISIEKELKIIADYIDLEKLRYNESVPITFSHSVSDDSEMIPPLLLLPLVENAFKHGISNSRGNRFVDVMFTVRDHNLHFVIKNSMAVANGSSTIGGISSTTPESNIGLSNLRRRLSLLYTDFSFSAESKGDIFIVDLHVNLTSHG